MFPSNYLNRFGKSANQSTKKEYENIIKALDIAEIMVSENKSLNELRVPKINLYLYNSFNNYSVAVYDTKLHVHVYN